MSGKVLITGGAGFMGFHLARHLVEGGYRVDLVDSLARGVRDPELEELLSRPRATLIVRDLLNPDALDDLADDYDFVIHLAALLGVANVRQRPYDVLTFNDILLQRMIDFCRRQKALRRLLFPSTSEVYGGTLRYFDMPVPTPESTPLAVNDLAEPRTSYMLSKILGEALCRYSGLPFTIFRPHNVYGPRMGLSHVVPELLKKARDLGNDEALEVYSPSHKRTFCYVSDAVEMIVRMMETPSCEGETLNVGNEEPEVAIGELARIILKTVGRDNDILPMPDTPGSPQRRAPDMTRTTGLIGFRAQVDPADGVARTYRWYREKIFEGGGVSAR
jgi:nucleoside-diphosphate-sugar epimerase